MRIIWFITLIATGCGGSETRHETTILGVRTNHQGAVIEQIVRERIIRSRAVLLAPDGPTHSIQYEDKYYVQAKDTSKHEVPATRANEFTHCGGYWPVEDSALWIAVGIDPLSNMNTGHVAVIDGAQLVSHNENDLHIVLFDSTHIVSHRTFSVVPKWESSADEFTVTNANHVVIFRSPQGFKRYDVLANKVGE